MELFEKSNINDKDKLIEFIKRFIHTMFGYDNLYNVDNVFPKNLHQKR